MRNQYHNKNEIKNESFFSEPFCHISNVNTFFSSNVSMINTAISDKTKGKRLSVPGISSVTFKAANSRSSSVAHGIENRILDSNRVYTDKKMKKRFGREGTRYSGNDHEACRHNSFGNENPSFGIRRSQTYVNNYPRGKVHGGDHHANRKSWETNRCRCSCAKDVHEMSIHRSIIDLYNEQVPPTECEIKRRLERYTHCQYLLQSFMRLVEKGSHPLLMQIYITSGKETFDKFNHLCIEAKRSDEGVSESELDSRTLKSIHSYIGMLDNDFSDMIDDFISAESYQNLPCPKIRTSNDAYPSYAEARCLLLKNVPKQFKGFVDPNDTRLPYPEQRLLEAMEHLLDNAKEGIYTYSGGRFLMAMQLRENGPKNMQKMSAGQICHLIQVLLNVSFIAYETNQVKLVCTCKNLSKAIWSKTGTDAQLSDEEISKIGRNIQTLTKECSNGIPLSQLKLLYETRFKEGLDYTVYGYTKLVHFLDEGLKGYCELKATGPFNCSVFPPKSVKDSLMKSNDVSTTVSDSSSDSKFHGKKHDFKEISSMIMSVLQGKNEFSISHSFWSNTNLWNHPGYEETDKYKQSYVNLRQVTTSTLPKAKFEKSRFVNLQSDTPIDIYRTDLTLEEYDSINTADTYDDSDGFHDSETGSGYLVNQILNERDIIREMYVDEVIKMSGKEDKVRKDLIDLNQQLLDLLLESHKGDSLNLNEFKVSEVSTLAPSPMLQSIK